MIIKTIPLISLPATSSSSHPSLIFFVGVGTLSCSYVLPEGSRTNEHTFPLLLTLSLTYCLFSTVPFTSFLAGVLQDLHNRPVTLSCQPSSAAAPILLPPPQNLYLGAEQSISPAIKEILPHTILSRRHYSGGVVRARIYLVRPSLILITRSRAGFHITLFHTHSLLFS